MADNTDEEKLDNPENIHSKSSPDEIIPTTDTETYNPNIETENMEVHHHAHHSGKKNWKTYFWEFLMLFLAVFFGFLAEYQLEHVIEHQREKQYMQSLVYDLQNDTTNLNAGFPLKNQRLLAIDSMFLFFEANANAKIIPGAVYRFMRRSLWDRHYRRNSTTIDQLKNAGGLRLIRKRNVRDSIAAYDLQWQRAEFWREGYITLQDKGKNLVQKIINANDLLTKYRIYPGFQNDRNITDSISIHINSEYLNDFLNFSADQKITTSQDKMGYQTIEKTAERLIAMIKKEYYLE